MAWLAIMALVAKMVAAIVCHPQFANAANQIVDNVLGPIVICTGHGPQPLTDSDREPGQSSIDHCPACALVKMFGLAVLLAISHFAFSVLLIIEGPSSAPPVLPSRLRLGSIQSRAPPARLSPV